MFVDATLEFDGDIVGDESPESLLDDPLDLIAQRDIRRQMIARLAAERRLRRAEVERIALVERQLLVETEARLEQMSMTLQIIQTQEPEAVQSLRTSPMFSMLLATMLSARELLAQTRDTSGRSVVSEALYHLERQAEALNLAAAQL